MTVMSLGISILPLGPKPSQTIIFCVVPLDDLVHADDEVAIEFLRVSDVMAFM